ncbi:MAG: Arc family DNA-binding protein [Alphaproteobacteria bacterium]|nr:Arc family DNA-binding protein [Alphaproteobacteria bacterium]
MAQILVRNLDEEIKSRLRRRADRHGRSVEAEVREILRDAVRSEDPTRLPLGSRIAARFVGIGIDDDLPELHGSALRPMDVDR